MTRVLVTPRSLTAGEARALRPLAAAGHEIVLGPAGRQPTAHELAARMPGCAGWLAGVEPITRATLAGAPELRAISRNGAGVDSIDLDAAREHGVEVLRATGANAQGVAELTVGLMLAVLRAIPASAGALRDGRWERALGAEARGRVLGVIGAGAIGQTVLDVGRALGMQPLASDPQPSRDDVEFVAVAELLARADVISLHCPAPADGRPVLGRDELARLRPGAVLVNTARAALVDEDAVLEALHDGRLRGFATDVFATEPPGRSPLLAHPRVVATPHVGGYTVDSVQRAASAAVENLLRALG